ncbi:MAG: class I SAM-dependent methyltransferase [Cellulosilyticaceae bacterium]
MNTTIYDDKQFFEAYKEMARSKEGLAAAGEWHELQKLLPDFSGQRVLDLGCGFGWHCRYAADQGACLVEGIDVSRRMLARAREMTMQSQIHYKEASITSLVYEAASFDTVISSLALHYVADFESVCESVSKWLVPGGRFVFSVEHPIFTAEGSQSWHVDADGTRIHWPVDRYFEEGYRETTFLGECVGKHHRTLTHYMGALLQHGFEIIGLVEPMPEAHMLVDNQEMQDELRRPMMLLIAARKK